MKKINRFFHLMRIFVWGLLSVALTTASLAAGSTFVLASHLNVPSSAPLAAGLLSGTSCSAGCNLWAETGTMPQASLPGSPAAGIPVYGYNTLDAAVAAPGGPLIIANQGETLTITLHNKNIPNMTSLSISGLPVVPDAAGIAMGNTKTYTFAAGQPGTYLYEAGMTPDGPRQAAMGLYGALIVRPSGAASQAYANPNTAFNDEAVLVLSEIDPAFNAAPASFDMGTYAPKYWLINGKTYPNTDPITAAASDQVLLRYVNAGLVHHSMGLSGLHQTIYAADAHPLTNPRRVVAETIPTGTTLDTIVTAPAVTAPVKYPLFEAAMHLDNSGTSTGGVINFGGMLTFLTVGTGTPPPAAPVTSGVSLSPNLSNASAPLTLTANVASTTSNIAAAEYFIDGIGANGSGIAMSGAFGSLSVNVSATLSVAQLSALTSGNHTVYVHGQDANGIWSAVASAVLNLDKSGPAISAMTLTPNLDNGTADVQLQATASDVATGNQNVSAAEFFIDPAGTPAPGTGTAIPVAAPTTIVSLTATIPAATVNALTEGNHSIAVRAQDALGNWGAFGTILLKVDKTGPNTSALTIKPNPNNGSLGVQITTGGAFYARIDALVSDPIAGGVNSNIVAAEYFVDTVGASGSGGAMIPTDGAFNSPSEAAYGAIDLMHIAAMTQGAHSIYVRGQDAAGNWGPTTTTTLVIDKTAPAISALSSTPNPANLAATVTLSVTAADPANTGTAPAVNAPASNLTGGEYFWGGTDPGAGSGTAFSFAAPASSGTFTAAIDVSQRTIFTNNTLSVRVKDAAGNWSAVSTTTIVVDRIFANSFPTGAAPYGWSATGGTAARLSLNAAANMKDSATNAMAANVTGGTSGYVVNTLATAQGSYDARFYVNPNGIALGSAAPTIFAAMNGTTSLFAVQMRLNGGLYQVHVIGAANGSWYTISGPTVIEVVRNGTSLTLYTGGTLRQTIAVSATTINAVRLGLSAGVNSGVSGTMYFDGFVSSRTTYVGP